MLPMCLCAQITVQPANTPPFTPESIISNVFLGSGVEIESVDYLGAVGSVGIFENGLQTIGLDRGIVLSSGWIDAVPKVASENSEKTTSGGLYEDLELAALAGLQPNQLKDVAKYEITFIPTSDTLKFRYVFASEEYPEFQCRLNNDAFGFFIKGPNPNGPDYNFTNIALVPDPNQECIFLDLPVTINTVNNGIDPSGDPDSPCQSETGSLDHSTYYNEVLPNSQPVFNGYLDVFEAKAAVIPCEAYTIKIVIADGLDGENDSAVFLEEKSFSTGSLQIDVDNPGLDGGISEGCLPGSINIALPRVTPFDFPIEFRILTDPSLPDLALPGIDFENINTSLFIPAGSNSTSLALSPISDNEEEGIEFIYIEINRDVCNVDTLIVPIYDNSLDFVTIPDTVFTCIGRGVPIEATIGSGVNITDVTRFSTDITFNTNDIDTTFSAPIQVDGLPQQFLDERMIAEICIDTLSHTRLNDLDIYLESPGGQILELSTDNGARADNDSQEDMMINTCFMLNASANINLGNPNEGQMDLSNPTYIGQYTPEGDWLNWLGSGQSFGNGEYNLVVTDDSGGEFPSTLTGWSIAFNATYEIEYEWFPSANLSCNDCVMNSAVLQSSQYIYLRLTDSYSCSNLDSVWVEVYPEPEMPIVSCEALSTSSIQLTWPDAINADDYQIRINDAFPWFNNNTPSQFPQIGYNITTFAGNQVIIDGLTPEENIEIIIRAITNAPGAIIPNCFSPNDTIYCQSLPCANTAPVIDSIIVDQPACETQGGVEVQVFASDPDQPLNYYVYTDNMNFERPNGVFLNLAQGNWPLKVIDATGCITLDTIRIDDPPPIGIIPDIQNISCNGLIDGTISIDIASNDPPYIYEWGHTSDPSPILTNLGPDNYSLTVTDGKGCTEEVDIEIINPETINYQYIQIEPIDCLGLKEGSATLSISGGLAPYEIEWNGSTVTDTITTLQLGFAVFKITDSYGCMVIDSALVEQNSDFDVAVQSTELLCFFDSTATATVTPSGGLEPYMYDWGNGEETNIGTGLHGGSNYVTITDTEGCEVIFEVEIMSPPPLELALTMTPTSCFGGDDGRLEIDISGGAGSNYEIEWFDGTQIDRVINLSAGNYCVTIIDESDCEVIRCFDVEDVPRIEIQESIFPSTCETECDGGVEIVTSGGSGNFFYSWTGPNNFASNTQNLSSLCVGNYALVVSEKDDPNCFETFEIAVGPDSNLEPQIIIEKFVSCNGEEDAILEAIPSGGVSPFTYAWSSNVTFQNDSLATDLGAGVYNVTVVDGNGCQSTASLELGEPDELMAIYNNVDVLCFGESTGAINMEIIGGTPISSTGDGYIVEWDTGDQTYNLDSLMDGNYIVSITDKNGCQAIEQTKVEQPDEQIEIIPEIEEVTCFGRKDGTVRLKVLNAVKPISYSLDNSNFKFDSTFLSLDAGDYTAYILDANGCMFSHDFFLMEGEPLEVDLGDNQFVDLGGSIILNALVENNQGNINYFWDAPNIANFTCLECPNPEIVNITNSFSVTVTIIDDNGCEGRDFMTVFPVEERAISVPTGFTPNGDNINDRLIVFGSEDISIMTFNVYDRWGELVFQNSDFKTNNESEGWNGLINGRPAPKNTYVWTAEFSLKSGRINFAKGQTVLIR